MKLEVRSFGDAYTLSAAVLVYTSTERGHAFATKHEVNRDGEGRPVIRPGTPFKEQDYKALIEALAPKEQPRMQWHEPRVLARGLGRMLWWSAPQKRSLFFKQSTYNAKTFDGKGVCACPGLVFMSVDDDLYVYAYKGTEAPTRATKLYQAPFFNVWSRGGVCVGNAVRPQKDQRDDPDAWERMFFGSHFTHPNFTQADRLTVGVDPVEFWQAQLKSPSSVFPEEVLFDLKLTIEDLLQVDLRARLNGIPRAKGEF